MKIRRLLLRGFGCLRGEYHFAGDRVNLVLEPNERGKSTLAAAILAGLYGFPAGQRRSENRPVPESDVYRPWAGDDYLVEMDVEAGGRVYTVRRNFARKDERVFEWRTGRDITEEFQTSRDTLDFCGRLSGIDREDFARTAFLRQSEVRDVRNASGVTAALQRMATSQQGDVAASEAIETLKSSIRSYRGRKVRRGKIDSEIAEITKEIDDLSDRIHAMERRRREAEDRIRDLEHTSAEEGRVETHLQRLEYLVIASGRQEDATRLEQEDRERAEIEEREAEFQSLSAWADFPSDRLQRILELKARLQALSEEEERIRERAFEDVDVPLDELEGKARATAGLSAPAPEALARFTEAESELAAAWRARKDTRRGLRDLHRTQVASGLDPGRLRSLSERFGVLKPDDRRFLLSCGEQEVSARSAAADREREAERVEGLLLETEERTRRSSAARSALALVAAAGAIGAAALFLSGQPRTWAYAAAALAAVAFLVRLAMAPSDEAGARLASLRTEKEGLAAALAAGQEEVAAIRSRLESLARLCGFDTGEALLEAFREAESHQEESAGHAALQRRRSESDASLRSAGAVISEIMSAAGHRPRFGAVTPRSARRFRLLAASHRETLARMEEIGERRRGYEAQIASLEEERAAMRREVSDLIESARLEPTDDLDAAIAAFEQGQQKRERHETLRREVIPALVRRAMSHQGEPLRRAVEVADAVLRRRAQENPDLAGLAPGKSHKEYAEERDRHRQTSRSLAERRMQLSADLSEVLREYRKEYPDTLRWLREWREVRERAVAFRAAVETACDVLEALSREAYAEWADVLNERASEALSILAPGYDDLRFDQDLTFTLRDRGDGERRGREDVDFRFSAGARDQIYLAARLAMAGYLSSGAVRLPLVFDDPFALFDDERFSRGMEMLADKVSRRHQVILLSCHETRHRSWQEKNPERFAERVRIMALATSTV